MAELDPLSASEAERYARQLSLPEVGVAGQQALKHSKVLIVGVGGLGTPLAAYLTAAGVGTLGLVDADAVSLSNLQRQILYATHDADRPKVWAAKARLEALNPEVTVVGYEEALDASNAPRLLAGYDLIADATDNFAARYALMDAAWRQGIPVVHASVYRHEGQLSVFAPGESPCYRCLCPVPPETTSRCGDAGVLGVLPGLLGVMQATEVLKRLLGIGRSLTGRLLIVEALGMRFTEIGMASDPACGLCGDAPRDLAASAAPGQASEEDLEVSAVELAALAEVTFLDVRDVPSEAAFRGARHLPMARLLEVLPTLPVEPHYVLVCEYGEQSRHAARLLRGAGLSKVWSLRGGARVFERLNS